MGHSRDAQYGRTLLLPVRPLHGKSLRRQTEAFYVRWNPLYYLVFIFAAICIVVGRIEHSIICSQGQPVRGRRDRHRKRRSAFTGSTSLIVSTLFFC